MLSLLRCALVAALAVPAASTGAMAEGAARTAPRHVQAAPRIKDCTRYNGRFGYYGNPWCTAAEQARWDRAEARRIRLR